MQHTPPTPVTRWDRLALILIVMIGAALRFQHLGSIEYNVDQVYPIWQALLTIDSGQLPLAGQGTSVLFANPPLTGYFFVPFIALIRQPIAAYAVTLMMNTFAIGLAYRGVRHLLGTRPALIAAALFAANPWIIEDSRRTWVQSLAPFFVCLIFWALVPVLTGQTRAPRRRLLVALIGLALFAHTYLLAYALVPPVSLLVLLFWQRIPKRMLGIGAAIFVSFSLLYGIGLVRQWDDTATRAESFASGEPRLSDEALQHALRLVTGNGYAQVRGTRAPADDADLRDALTTVIHALWTAAILTGLFRAFSAVYAHINRKGILQYAPKEVGGLILLIWFLLPILMMSYVSRVVHPFYLHLTLPAGHALAAWGIVTLTGIVRHRIPPYSARGDHGRGIEVGLIVVLLAFTTAINTLNTIRFAQQTTAHPGEDLPETLPLAQAHDLGARIREARDPGMAVFSLMHDWTPVTLAGEVFRTAYTETYGRAAIVPPEGGLYILFETPGDPAPIVPPFAEQAEPPLILTDGTAITLWQVDPDAVRIDHALDIPTDIDLRFLGWTLDGDLAPGERVTLYTIWHVDALHPDRGTWSFLPVIKVVNAAGEQVATDQGHAVAALTWQVGDLIVQRLDLTIPESAAAPFALQLSLFDPVRVNGGGGPGINAVFQVEETGETVYTAEITLSP